MGGQLKPNDTIVDYPHQPVVLDTILVERTSNKVGNYAPIEPGAPFRKGTHTAAQLRDLEGNMFLGQKATADDEWMEQHWGKAPSTQDIYNWEEGYSEESISHPIFIRRYLERRDSYAPRAKAAALPGLYRINVTAAGANFTSAPTVVFTGGTGSGASAIAVLDNNGGIAKVTLKAEGTYTVAPTISFTGGGGAGATAVASVQGAACLLVEEKVTNNAPFPYDSLYIVANRVYETLPGPVITTTKLGYDGVSIVMTRQRKLVSSITTGESVGAGVWTKLWHGDGNSVAASQMSESMAASGEEVITAGYEQETGAATRTVVYRQELGTALPAIASTRVFDGLTMYCWDAKESPLGDSKLVGMAVVEYMELPDSYTERPSRGFQFPAMFAYITGWATDYDGIYDPPWPGVHFTLSAHRTASKPMTATHTFSVGVPGTMPDTWTVTTPGKASKIFPTIGDNTIHNDWTVTETTDSGTYTVEIVPDSTPNAYDPTDELTVEADAKRWNSVFWKKTILTTTEEEP